MLRTLLYPLAIVCFLFSCSSDKSAVLAPAGKMTVELDPPTNLRVENLTDTSVRFAWDEVEGATSYYLSYKEKGEKWISLNHNGTQTFHDFRGLKESTRYSWAIKAGLGGQRSEWAFGPKFTTAGGSGEPAWVEEIVEEGVDKADRFDIEVLFPLPSQFTQKERELVRQAARRWEEIVVSDMPDHVVQSTMSRSFSSWDEPNRISVRKGEQIDDVRVYVISRGPAGNGPVARYHPLLMHPETQLPIIGVVEFTMRTPDWGSPWIQNADRAFYHIALHELGHALGIGAGPQWMDVLERRPSGYLFPGAASQEQFKKLPRLVDWMICSSPFRNCQDLINGKRFARYPYPKDQTISVEYELGRSLEYYEQPGGTLYSEALVPVEPFKAHWATLLTGDIMSVSSGFAGSYIRRPRISAISVGALDDMGYEVDYSEADAWAFLVAHNEWRDKWEGLSGLDYWSIQRGRAAGKRGGDATQRRLCGLEHPPE